MAIFHSYVCLPEGISFAPAPNDATETAGSAWLVAPHEDVSVQVALEGALRRKHGLESRGDGDVTLRSDTWAMILPINGWYIGSNG